MESNPNTNSASASIPARADGMARLALGLSVMAFFPPFAVAAIVLGHIAERRLATNGNQASGKAQARAALWIAYLQLAVVSIAGAFLLGLFGDTAQGFRRDVMVQQVFREYDRSRPLDAESAQQAEATARSLMYQLIAIEEESARSSADGLYVCNFDRLLATGLKGTTEAETKALAERVAESPYRFAISGCNPGDGESRRPAFVLTAAPISPRMPSGSAVYCAEQDGVLRQARGGTSADCLKTGLPID